MGVKISFGKKPCPCIDCEGTEPTHAPDCQYMIDTFGGDLKVVPAADTEERCLAIFLDKYRYVVLAVHGYIMQENMDGVGAASSHNDWGFSGQPDEAGYWVMRGGIAQDDDNGSEIMVGKWSPALSADFDLFDVGYPPMVADVMAAWTMDDMKKAKTAGG